MAGDAHPCPWRGFLLSAHTSRNTDVNSRVTPSESPRISHRPTRKGYHDESTVQIPGMGFSTQSAKVRTTITSAPML